MMAVGWASSFLVIARRASAEAMQPSSFLPFRAVIPRCAMVHLRARHLARSRNPAMMAARFSDVQLHIVVPAAQAPE
jgi:hypothetical protein